MSSAKNILFLHAGNAEQARLETLAMALAQIGSAVTVEDLDSGNYDHILDAVAYADTVVYWPAESAG